MKLITDNLNTVDKNRVEAFLELFPEKGHLWFAMHLAPFEALTKDLVYKVWLNFRLSEEQTPLTVVADILSSPICQEIGNDLFVIHRNIRQILLNLLAKESKSCETKIEKIYEFSLAYLDYNQDRIPSKSFEEAQRWAAKSFFQPDLAAKELLAMYNQSVREKKQEKGKKNKRRSNSKINTYLNIVSDMNKVLEGNQSKGTDSLKITSDLISWFQKIEEQSKEEFSQLVEEFRPYIKEEFLNNEDFPVLIPFRVMQELDLLQEEDSLQSRIKKVKETNSTALILKNLKLTEIPKELLDLPFLEKLDLSFNQISEIEILGGLINLKELILSNNKIIDTSLLKNLTKLTTLNLSDNQIIDISFLKNLNELTELNLSSNQIIDISFLKNLNELTELNLSSNQIIDISFLKNLIQLKSLYLRSNQIVDISYLKNLLRLIKLDLSFNKIRDISYLKSLTKLVMLDVSTNQINDISFIISLLDQFESIELKSTFGSNVGVLNLTKNPIINPPLEILDRGIPATQRYFNQLKTQGTEPIYEARILVVGEGKAGKTTLVKKFLDINYPVPNDEDETVGIQITEGHPLPYPKDESVDFRTHIWDFGGQEIQYMTHQFFLTPDSLYILVVDDREESSRLPYWFHTIRLLGSEQREGRMEYSPVLVVLNKKNNTGIGVNYDALKYDQNFPDLKKIVRRIDFKNDTPEDIAELNQKITNLVCQLPIVGRQVPKQWKLIRIALREENKPYIPLVRFREICQDNRIEDPLNQDQILWYLHKLGIIIHFQEEDTEFALRDTLVLQPKWALTAIYRLLLHEEIKQEDGIFTHKLMTTIWADYSPKEQDFLLKLMLANKFDLVLPLEGRQRRYIAPVRLSKATPKFDFVEQDALRFRYDFEFMPEGIITRLIVREGRAIQKNARGKRLVWKTGVVLEDAKTGVSMLVKEGLYPQQIIDILISGGSHAARVDGLARIRSGIDNILGTWFENAKYDKLVPCNCETCLTLPANKRAAHKYDSLWERYRKGVGSQCEISFDAVSPMQLLRGVDTPENLNKHQPSDRFGFDINAVYQNPKLEKIMREEGHSIRENTNQNADRILTEIPIVFRKELNQTEQQILSEIFEKIEDVQLYIEHSKELIEVVGKGIDTVIDELQDDTLATEIFKIQRQLKKADVDLKQKLKVSLPLIPLILKYETELSGDIFSDLKKRWKEGGWKAIFSEELKVSKKVFISYSWDSEAHKNWVLNLAEKLIHVGGVDVILNQYELKEGQNITNFMNNAVAEADKILVIMTDNYNIKSKNSTSGVGLEYSLIKDKLTRNQNINNKIILILRDGTIGTAIPQFLRSFLYEDMRDDSNFEQQLKSLIRNIYDAPLIKKLDIPSRYKEYYYSKIKEEIHDLIADNKLNKAINLLLKTVEEIGEDDLKNQVLVQSAKFKNYIRNKKIGILSSSDERITLSRIINNILEITNDISVNDVPTGIGIEQLRNHLIKNEIKEIIEELNEFVQFLDDDKLKNLVHSQTTIYNEYNTMNMEGVLTNKDSNLMRAKLVNGILEIIDRME